MIFVLVLCAILGQASSQAAPTPLIDNDRVTVWEVSGPTAPRSLDAVVVPLSGGAAFFPKGAQPVVTGRSILIELKNHPVARIANPGDYPLAFPRPGSNKILENERVTVWDYTWTPGAATPMHFHDKDTVAVFLGDGEMKSTTPDGQAKVTSLTFGEVQFNPRNRTHTETLVSGKERAIITELN